MSMPSRASFEAVVSVAQPLAQPKASTCRSSVAEDLPLGRGDERRLTQVLLNLVGNAIKFTDAGSVTIAATAVGDLLELAVTDTGPGIAPADQERIFDAFQQVDNSSTPAEGRYGSRARDLKAHRCRCMAGRSTVESVLGAGFHLPDQAPAPGWRGYGGGLMKRILVVEDTWHNRKMLRDLLTRAGFEVLEAVNGEEGVAQAEQHRPDLILMDIQLPLVDGYDATRRIKANPALHHIPIIAVTSYALAGDEAKTREAGCDGYVAKPFSPRNLLAKVQEFLA